MVTTQKEIRKMFWKEHPDLAYQAKEAGVMNKRQNEHCATTRCAFCDFVDGLWRDGQISGSMVEKVTL